MNADIAATVAQYRKHAERTRVRAVRKIQPRLFEVASAYDRAADRVQEMFPDESSLVPDGGFQEAAYLADSRVRPAGAAWASDRPGAGADEGHGGSQS